MTTRMRRWVVAIAVFGTLLPVSAQETRPGEAPARSTDRTEAALEEIADSLREIAASQRLLLVMQRVELAQSRLDPLLSELSNARDEVKALTEEFESMTTWATHLEQQIEDAIRSGADPTTIAEKDELDQVETMTTLLEQRLSDAERRVMDAENDVARSRRKVEILDERLETLFESFEASAP